MAGDAPSRPTGLMPSHSRHSVSLRSRKRSRTVPALPAKRRFSANGLPPGFHAHEKSRLTLIRKSPRGLMNSTSSESTAKISNIETGCRRSVRLGPPSSNEGRLVSFRVCLLAEWLYLFGCGGPRGSVRLDRGRSLTRRPYLKP